jgi:hypothetical protein
MECQTQTRNGKLSAEEWREIGRAILDGPVPEITQATIQEAVRDPYCWRDVCRPNAPCKPCEFKIRLLAFQIQRIKFGIGQGEPQTDGPVITPVVRTVATVTRRPVRWLWAGYFARGAVSILDGDPGLGKSTITLDLTARVSRGWSMPPASGPDGSDPEDVIILSAEDDASRTIRPRLEAAGADLERVRILDGIRTIAHVLPDGAKVPESERPPMLPRDLDHLESIVRQHAAAMVIVDPIMTFLDPETDAHKDQDVRLVLHRLSKLAAATDAAVLLVRHLNKYRSADAIYRGGGSVGIIGAARSGLLVARHPETPNTFVLAGTKANLAPMPASLTYTMEPAGDVARIAWGEETEITADELVQPRKPDKSPEAKAEKQERQNHSDDGSFLAALDRIVEREISKPGRKAKKKKKASDFPQTKNQIQMESGLSPARATRALGRLVDAKLLESVTVTVGTGKNHKVMRQETGYRRACSTEPTEPTEPTNRLSGSLDCD